MADAPRAHDGRHALVIVPAHIPLPGGKHRADVVVAPAVDAVGEVVGRIVEVNVFAVPAVHEAFDVVGAAHADAAGHLVGMTHGEVQRVIGAKAASGHDDLWIP